MEYIINENNLQGDEFSLMVSNISSVQAFFLLLRFWEKRPDSFSLFFFSRIFKPFPPPTPFEL